MWLAILRVSQMLLNKPQFPETEKNKKIEKIKTNGNEFYSEYIEAWIKKSEFDAYGEYLSNKLNAVIDKLNYLLEKSDSNVS